MHQSSHSVVSERGLTVPRQCVTPAASQIERTFVLLVYVQLATV